MGGGAKQGSVLPLIYHPEKIKLQLAIEYKGSWSFCVTQSK